jgi:hypothetical protein
VLAKSSGPYILGEKVWRKKNALILNEGLLN